MKEDKIRRLNRLLWQERLKTWLPRVLILIIVAGGAIYLTAQRTARIDRTVESHIVAGKAMCWAKMAGRRGGFTVHVKLDGGDEIDATSLLPLPPVEGEHVEVRALSHVSGRVTYRVVRQFN